MLSIRIGVIGPKGSVERIKSVARELNGNFTIVEKTYNSYEELENLQSFCKDLDSLLFSGQLPYFWVKARENPDIPMIYVARNGTCLYRTLFDLFRNGVDVSSLSFDTITKSTIEETYEELNLPLGEINTFDYDSFISYDDIIDFHKKLWESKKTKAAVTCLQKPYEELTKQGILTYRIYPTKSIIRRSIERALLFAESARLKEAQMALILVRADEISEKNNKYSRYEIQRLILDLEQVLLDYCEQNHASMVKTGDAEFMLITTRGCIEEYQNLSSCTRLLKNIRNNFPLKVTIGIGFGRTARMSESNARVALNLSAQEGSNCCFLIGEKGEVLGPLRPEADVYSGKLGVELEELSKKLNMNTIMLLKIKAAIRQIGKTMITPQELGVAMNLSERSARRILSKMEEKGAVEIVGNKSFYNKGRPRLMYKILI